MSSFAITTDFILYKLKKFIFTAFICLSFSSSVLCQLSSSSCCISCIGFIFYGVCLPHFVAYLYIPLQLVNLAAVTIFCHMLGIVLADVPFCSSSTTTCSFFEAYLSALPCIALVLVCTLFCLSCQILYCPLDCLALLSGTSVFLSIPPVLLVHLRPQ